MEIKNYLDRIVDRQVDDYLDYLVQYVLKAQSIVEKLGLVDVMLIARLYYMLKPVKNLIT